MIQPSHASYRLGTLLMLLVAFISSVSAASAQSVQLTVAPLAFGTPLLGYQAILQSTYTRATDSLAAVYHYQPANATYHYRLATSFEKGSDQVRYFPYFQYKLVFGLYAAEKLIVRYSVELKSLDDLCQHPGKLLTYLGQVYQPVFQEFAGTPQGLPLAGPSWNLVYQGADNAPIKQLRQVVTDVFVNLPVSRESSLRSTLSTVPAAAISIMLQPQPHSTHISIGFPNAAAVSTRCGAPLKTEFDVSSAEIAGSDFSFLFAKMKQSAYEYALNR